MPSGIYIHKKRPPFSQKWKDNLSKALKGRKVWNEGKKFEYKPRPKMKGIVPWNKGKVGSCPHTKEWGEMMSKKMRGEKGSNWQGGITALNFRIRNSFRYCQWRSDIFTRDNWTCQVCDKRGVYLEAHHIKMFNVLLKENNIKCLEDALVCEILWDLNNGITFCKECHKVESKKQMGNNKYAVKNGLAKASIKSRNSLAIGSIKSINGLE